MNIRLMNISHLYTILQITKNINQLNHLKEDELKIKVNIHDLNEIRRQCFMMA